MEYYSVIKKNGIMSFARKGIEPETEVEPSKSGSERQRLHVFSLMWKIDPKDKHVYNNKYDQGKGKEE
jgi:hypothetical protein